ncbi:MAG: serine/threonine-protein phosphatase [Prevotella sp.]|nr:serine/threonine-protein phosphatase [Prevotella sp.]
MIELEISAACRIGCVRHDNEDMILVGHQFIRNDEYRTLLELGDGDRYMMAVADGMGGHLSGEVASSDVLHNLQFFFNDLPVGLDASSFIEMIMEWLESINIVLDSKGKANEQYKGMGTTLVALAYYEGAFYSMNCGDSRLYRIRNEELVQLTTDHSLSSLMGNKKHSSIITNCIGGGCTSSYIDLVQIEDIQDGDAFLLCSDGLTDMMSDHRLNILLTEGADANDLCNAAIVRGGFDNVSACLIKVKR